MRASWGKPKRKYQRTESALFRPVFQWLFAHGCYVYRQNSGAYKTDEGQFIRYGLAGASDLVGLTRTGRFLAVELKAPKGVMSDAQEAYRDRIEAQGGIYIEARSIDDLEARKAEILG